MRYVLILLTFILSQVIDAGVLADEVNDIDNNNDGVVDESILTKNGIKVFKKKDKDFDGMFDIFYYYKKNGALMRHESDTNKDGKPDKWIYFVRGRELVLKEYDLNFDGKIDKRKLDEWSMDRRMNIMRYRPIWKELDTDFDGIIDQASNRNNKEEGIKKVGTKINPDYERGLSEEEGQSLDQGGDSLWNVRDAVKNRATFEVDVKRSRERLSE